MAFYINASAEETPERSLKLQLVFSVYIQKSISLSLSLEKLQMELLPAHWAGRHGLSLDKGRGMGQLPSQWQNLHKSFLAPVLMISTCARIAKPGNQQWWLEINLSRRKPRPLKQS